MEFERAAASCEGSLRVAREIPGPPFQAEAFVFWGDVHRLAGRNNQAIVDLEEALRISRRTGMAYLGPWYLGLLAVATEDPQVRAAALDEGEAILTSNGVSHNHLQFRRYAIDACLAGEDWAGAGRHADRLEEFTAAEPLPWASFFAARGRALAMYGTGDRSSSLRAKLQGLSEQGRGFGFIEPSRSIDAAALSMGSISIQ